ncbi:tripartite tricarboxylate transporter TctB family protein [Salinarimonas chemoclinalis]|uniref:tripartite tricarboxylate transporter TctB family protein n=1 Tax=Salinarimonas chemoclinalis TaxID=3241599 RepID=UPI0035568B40
MRTEPGSNRAPERARGDVGTIVLCVLFVALGGWMVAGSMAMSPLGAVFPRVIAAIMIASALGILALRALGRASHGPAVETGSTPRRLLLCVVLVAWAALMPRLGFFATSVAGFLAVLAIAEYDRWTAKRTAAYVAAALALVGGFWLLFVEVLLVPVPRGVLF